MPIIGQLLPGDVREFGHDRSIRFIRGRYLIAYFVLAFIVSFAVTFAALFIYALPELRDAGASPIIRSTIQVIFYVILFAVIFLPARGANIRLREFVPIMSFLAARWSVGTACALGAVSLGAVYVLYLPLSYVTPNFVESWLLDPERHFFWLEGDHYMLANVFNLIEIVILAPIAEELFFRGLLLRTWIAKWGAGRAIFFSSVLFAALHVEYLSVFIFSVVVSLAYIWSRNLAVPILIHMTNNLIASLFEGGTLIFAGPKIYTLAEFQAEWWIGVLALIIGVPTLVWFLRKGAPVAVATPTPTLPPQGEGVKQGRRADKSPPPTDTQERGRI